MMSRVAEARVRSRPNSKQVRALVIIHDANRRGKLPTTADLVHLGFHANTVSSLRRRGWTEVHLPEAGTDGFRLTADGRGAHSQVPVSERIRALSWARRTSIASLPAAAT